MKLNIIIMFSMCSLRVIWGKKYVKEHDDITITKESRYEEVAVNQTNILFFHFMGTTSHLYFMRPLAERLAEIGHNVTFVQYAPSKFQHENFKQILINDKLVSIHFVTISNIIVYFV